jgi:uncharacterized membrane protein YeaQ/YmgE (transglycosylase-associated protein family)
MGWIAWIVLGGVAFWIGIMTVRRITGGGVRLGIIVEILVGIAGAFFGSLILKLFGVQEKLAFNLNTLLVAVGGATVLLILLNLIRGRR